MSFSQQAKPLILAKNDKNLSKKWKNKTYKRKKRAKSFTLRKMANGKKRSFFYPYPNTDDCPVLPAEGILKKSEGLIWNLSCKQAMTNYRAFPEREKNQSLLFLSPLLIPYSEAD